MFIASELVFREMIARGMIESFKLPEQSVVSWHDLRVDSQKPLEETDVYQSVPWAAQWLKESKTGARGVRFAPYHIWVNKPYQNAFMTIDEEGFRQVVPDYADKEGDVRNVFFFGGSTMAGGSLNRDEDLIASQVCKLINERYPKVRFNCRNYGHNGYNSTNEILLLNKLLIQGKTPDYVVFFDGINDTIQQVVYGIPHNFKGLMEWAVEVGQNPLQYQRIRLRLAQIAIDTSMLLRWATGYELRNIIPLYVTIPSKTLQKNPAILRNAADAMAMDIFGKYRVVNALAEGLGFEALFVIQPNIFSSTKKMTEEEQKLINRHLEKAPFLAQAYRFSEEALRRERAISEMSNVIDGANMLDGVDQSVFFDLAHISPVGNAAIAKRMAESMRSIFNFDTKYD
tara:strand:- start:23709 stop:24905 length:1197 start_codon:yes stop_codon:yes gene_type:complete